MSESSYCSTSWPALLCLRMLLIQVAIVEMISHYFNNRDVSFISLFQGRCNIYLCVCVPIAPYCSLTHTLKNGGVLNRTSGEVGSKVHYYCKPGYRMIGHSNATCRRNSDGMYQWESLAPLCQGKERGFHPQTSMHHFYFNHSLKTTEAMIMNER